MIDSKARILEIIRARGPTTPMQIARELRVQSYISGAYLSELVGAGKLRISSLKVGNSPLYYLPGQQAQLESYAKNLNEKDFRTYTLLKETGVVRDADQDPLTRVSLRQIKDFAMPLEVSHDGRTEIYWRFVLFSPEETEARIQVLLESSKPLREERREAPKEQNEGVREERRPPKQEKIEEVREEKKPAKQEKLEDTNEEKPVRVETPPPEANRAVKPKRSVQKVLPEEHFRDVKDAFATKIRGYFSKNDIVIVQEETVKKGGYDFVVRVPSAVGELTYHCSARAKQKINEGDLATAYVTGERKKLPVLFVSSGELTKKAKEMLATQFTSMTFKKI